MNSYMISKKYFLNLLNTILSIILLVSVIEALTYSGFFVKHFSFAVGLIFLFLVIIIFFVTLKISKSKFYRNSISILTVLVMIVYLSLNFLESIKYSNYVFSHLRIHPEMLLLPVILMIIIFVLNGNEKRNYILFYGIIILALGQYIIKDFYKIKGSRPLFILKNINLSYDKKMEMLVEEKPYDYIMFIKSSTPDDSTILIPPQGYPWPQTSNEAYLRYFLYPRKLINGNEKDPEIDLKSVDYVLIDYGETDISQYGYTNIWPKFDVNGEYIIYWDPVSGKISKANEGKYVYDMDDLSEKWGIVKIRK